MARPLRVEFDGALYHVTARGNERRAIFRTDRDRVLFLDTLAECVRGHGLLVHAFCLMPNHYHLVVETPQANLSRGLGWLQTTYTIRFNRRHRRSGHLFQGRFKAHLVEADGYAMELLRYIHLNPVRPRSRTAPIPPGRRKDLDAFVWSSHRTYAGLGDGPPWLCMDWLSYFGRTRREARREYAGFVGAAFGQTLETPWDNLRGGLVLGGGELWERVRAALEEREGDEEVQWVRRESRPEAMAGSVERMLEETEDERLRVWIRVRLGGERKVDVARSMGYRDGSGVLQVLKRLERRAEEDAGLAALLRRLQKRLASSVQS